MHHLLFSTTTAVTAATTTAATMPSPSNPKPKSHLNNASSGACRHSPLATLDVLIMVVVLFSGAFLLSSYFSYIFNSLSLLLLHHRHHLSSFPYLLAFFLFFFAAASAALDLCGCFGARSRRCRMSGCRGLKNALEFDLKIQTEDTARRGGGEIEKLPWKGGSEGNPDYECLRSELRKMAPPNGRAVLLFRAPCGCAVAKLEGWGPKKGKRHKRSLANATLSNGGADNR